MTFDHNSQAMPPASAIVPKCPANNPPMAMMAKKTAPMIAAVLTLFSMSQGSENVNGS